MRFGLTQKLVECARVRPCRPVQHRRIPILLFAGALLACFIALRGGHTQSSPLRRITNTTEEGISLNPSLSGDGRVIAFESTEDVAAAGGSDYFRAIRADISNDAVTLFP